MTVYTVYEPPGDADLETRADKVAFVKDGFSWLALFVPILWLIYQKMWIELILFLALFLSLPWLFGTEPLMKEIAGWVSLGLTLLFAFEANDLRGWALRRRGYNFAGTARGWGRVEAEASFFPRWLAEQARQLQERRRGAGMAGPSRPVKDTAVAPTRPAAGQEVIGSFPQG